jgi:hypothetical protein
MNIQAYTKTREQQVVLIEHPHTTNAKLANLLTLLKLAKAKVATDLSVLKVRQKKVPNFESKRNGNLLA